MFIREVYRNTAQRITHAPREDGVPVRADNDEVSVVVTDAETGDVLLDDIDVDEELDDQDEFAGYSFVLPYSLTSTPRPLLVTWEFSLDGDEIESVIEVDVVTPYSTPYILREAYDILTPRTDDELIRTERIVRYLINRYCNQTFEYLPQRTINVLGTGSDTLMLPRRLIELHDVTAGSTVLFSSEQENNYTTHNSPWSLSRAPTDLNDTKRGFPGGLGTLFKSGITYDIVGDFGWRRVPAAVTEAALLLARDYFSPDKKYKEQYVHTIRAADWRMEFGKTGGQTTGNADADSMLDYYVNPRWAVVL